MFATGQICHTAGMVIVEERHQPPIQPLHLGNYSWKLLFCVCTTFVVHLSTVQQHVHLLLLMPQPDSVQWYLRNTIDLNSSNLCYM